MTFWLTLICLLNLRLIYVCTNAPNYLKCVRFLEFKFNLIYNVLYLYLFSLVFVCEKITAATSQLLQQNGFLFAAKI